MTDAELAHVRGLLESAHQRGHDIRSVMARRQLWRYWAPRLYDELVALRGLLSRQHGRRAILTALSDNGPSLEQRRRAAQIDRGRSDGTGRAP